MVVTQTSPFATPAVRQTVDGEQPPAVAQAVLDIPVRGFMDPAVLDSQTTFFVQFLDILHDTHEIRASHRRTTELLGVGGGFHLLDVGCGTGNFARAVAPLVGTTGRIVGVDLSPALLGVADRRAADLDVTVEFTRADAQQLPFQDATFDGCRAERVLQYLDQPRRALAEMMRVTRPGGRIVAAEVDWDTMVSDVPDAQRETLRRVSRARTDSAGNGWIGRQLRRSMLEVGLVDVTCEGFVVILTDATTVLDGMGRRLSYERIRDGGAISAEECARLIEAEETAGRAGQYFTAFTFFLVSGRKPPI